MQEMLEISSICEVDDGNAQITEEFLSRKQAKVLFGMQGKTMEQHGNVFRSIRTFSSFSHLLR
jgi:hypothetical protein